MPEENILKANIWRRFENNGTLEDCIREILLYIRSCQGNF